MADTRGRPARVYDVQAKLMKAFESRVGQTLYADDLAGELGVMRDTVQNGISNLRRHDKWREGLETVLRGSAWCYHGPNGSKGGDAASGTSKLCFEEIGKTREGDLIIQSDDGRIFQAHQL